MIHIDQLPAYQPSEHCLKCGHDVVVTFYCKGAYDAMYRSPCQDMYERHAEHLHRNCQCCHYEWIEAVIVTAPTEGEE